MSLKLSPRCAVAARVAAGGHSLCGAPGRHPSMGDARGASRGICLACDSAILSPDSRPLEKSYRSARHRASLFDDCVATQRDVLARQTCSRAGGALPQRRNAHKARSHRPPRGSSPTPCVHAWGSEVHAKHSVQSPPRAMRHEADLKECSTSTSSRSLTATR